MCEREATKRVPNTVLKPLSSSCRSFNLSIISSAAGDTKPLTKDMLGDTTLWLIIFVYPCILGMLLPLFNYLFTALAVLLNDFENYRTDTEYRNNLILKVFR